MDKKKLNSLYQAISQNNNIVELSITNLAGAFDMSSS